MKPSCLRAGALLDRGVEQLDAAERLVLEEHLTRCASCAGDALLLERLRSTLLEPPDELKPQARERVIERALRAPPRAPSRAERRGLVPALATAALALLVAWAWWPSAPAPEALRDGSFALELPALESSVRMLSGEGRSDDVALRAGDAAPTAARLELAGGARLAIGPATVDVLQPAQLQWREDGATLSLHAGSLLVEIPPGQRAPFRIASHDFVAEVLGTRFVVDRSGVRVQRGRVRVTALSGERLAELGADESWTRAEPATAAPARADTDALIARARRTLAERDVVSARRLLQQALAATLDRRQRAEAQSLLAECALLDGDEAAAARAYAEVAEQHGGTLAGEAALFAQARAEIASGQRDAARATLQRYLARHPSGRFVSEARSHLQRLGAK